MSSPIDLTAEDSDVEVTGPPVIDLTKDTKPPKQRRKRPRDTVRNKGTPIDPAFSPEQIQKALGLAGQVQQNFGGQGIPLAGVAGVGVWLLLVLRYTIFYGFFGTE